MFQAVCDCISVNDNLGALQEDILFKNPSYAVAFIIGGHANGLTEWKLSDGNTLNDIENSEAEGN